MEAHLIREFLIETKKSMGPAEFLFARLRDDPSDKESFLRIYMAIHSLNGACGFLGLSRTGRVAIYAEALLCKLRANAQDLDAKTIDALERTFGDIDTILSGLETTGQEPAGDDSNLITLLETVIASTAHTPLMNNSSNI